MRALSISLVLIAFAAPGCVESGSEPEALPQPIEARRLHYEPVDITAGPPGLDGWAAVGLADDGTVYGQGFDCNDDFSVCSFPALARGRDGAFRIVHPSFQVTDVDEKGNLGGCTIDDPSTFFGHAAVIRPDGRLVVLPARPGEVTACVDRVADDRVAAVTSLDDSFTPTSYVYDKGAVVPLAIAGSVVDINDRAQVAGITADGHRGFRFDARSGRSAILAPIAGDPDSWAQGINERGDVLGYSFVGGGVERIGHWDGGGQFHVSFVEGTAEYPTVSNHLAWNEAGLIAISFSFGDPSTYLVPAPGLRLNLADLVSGAEVPTTLFVTTVAPGGDLLASSMDDGRIFLFLRD